MTTKRPYRVEYRRQNGFGEWSDWASYRTVSTMAKATELVAFRRSAFTWYATEWRIVWTYQTVMDY